MTRIKLNTALAAMLIAMTASACGEANGTLAETSSALTGSGAAGGHTINVRADQRSDGTWSVTMDPSSPGIGGALVYGRPSGTLISALAEEEFLITPEGQSFLARVQREHARAFSRRTLDDAPAELRIASFPTGDTQIAVQAFELDLTSLPPPLPEATWCCQCGSKKCGTAECGVAALCDCVHCTIECLATP